MTRRFWTREEDELLRSIYPSVKTPEVAKALNRSVVAVYGHAELLGVEKNAAYLAEKKPAEAERLTESGKAHRFQKGLIPANKGLRRPGWAVGRMRETQFKKGQRTGAANNNWQPIGTEMMNSDGYMRLKVSDLPESIAGKGANNKNWVFVHRLVWEQAHGPIPEGYRIWWKDGDHTNNALSNLELLSGADHMDRTTMHNLPPAIREVIHLKGAINRAITMRGRNGEEQTQRSA